MPMAAIVEPLISIGDAITFSSLYGPLRAVVFMVFPVLMACSSISPVYALSMTTPFSILTPSLFFILAQTGNFPTRLCIVKVMEGRTSATLTEKKTPFVNIVKSTFSDEEEANDALTDINQAIQSYVEEKAEDAE